MKNAFNTLLLITSIISQAQVGIGVATASMDASAQLEVASTTKGFLPPRMLASERAAIASPAAGLLVFQIDAPEGLYYYTGSVWTIVGSAAVSSNFVDLSTTQTVAGAKTFQDGLTITNKPFLPPVLTQSEINALPPPTEGMVVYNSTTRKLQLYSVGTTDLINDSFAGTYSDHVDFVIQNFIVPASGLITQIQFYVKAKYNDFSSSFYANVSNGVDSSGGSINTIVSTSPQWLSVSLSTPLTVQSGQSCSLNISAMGIFFIEGAFGTNSSCSTGSAGGCCGPLNGDDIMFKLLITPTSGSAYWVIMN